MTTTEGAIRAALLSRAVVSERGVQSRQGEMSHQISIGRRLALAAGVAALLALSCLIQPAEQFPSGAPDSACKDLKPGHGVEAQSAASPFELSQDRLQVEQPGDQIKVTLSSPNKINFKGLMVQALNEKGEPKGRFLPGKGLKTLDSCSAVTHSDREAKKTATLVWEAPAELKSKEAFMFKATVVVKMDEFYLGIKSTLAVR